MKVPQQVLRMPWLAQKGVSITIRREDLLHPLISGNKFRKLKYNLAEAKEKGHTKLLTFGGAYSNHILATAAAGQEHGFATIGVIRGAELEKKWPENPTLSKASELGMRLVFVSRAQYRAKDTPHFLKELRRLYGDFYLLPEGGTNALAVKGCGEILRPKDTQYDVIASAVGTGGTLAGLIGAAGQRQKILGFSALKGNVHKDAMAHWVPPGRWEINTAYHFGGYGKINGALVHFINGFKTETGIPLDPIYTGKMLFGLLDMAKNDSFVHGTKILAVHTGGLQGIAGMNALLKKKNLPLLQ
ncbi:1-aminocyclopropane-1-carboxylate deaminase/D-cysteine desulfhydrase [Maribacter sp. 2307ULW6-5]|uniref:1-aminocyclopropane-1-carboxylate deaminase/D-cysteine desulfhydrase n=1 Tax=Maribacter sp. 2307ULW6-5 TaxID=3386275 RepID=UPI0039BC4F6A